MATARRLILVLGDQLDAGSAAFADADPERDVVVMAEVEAEIRRYPNHKQRVALFLAAMRHLRDELRARGFTVRYQQVDDDRTEEDLPAVLAAELKKHSPKEGAVLGQPGRHDLTPELERAARRLGHRLEVRPDASFLCARDEFASWAEGRSRLTLEHFYRAMRKRHGVLMKDGEPEGGQWNYDRDNRESFDRDPGTIKPPLRCRPDATTREVIGLVSERYADLPGSLERFDWPVTRDQARRAVRDFVAHRLHDFGTYQDAMWTDRAFLYHSRIAAPLNLKLIDPRYVIGKAENAYREGRVPLNSAEGFIRQILGWREFIRGVYWLHMPGYLERNALDARRQLPDLFWSGDTEMVCLRQTVRQLRETAYAHHIQRLMVTGLFALLYGVQPRRIHDWYMAMYADSVEWVTLPNTLGMSQFADGGIVGTKPYVASGNYIQRQSNYCDSCRFDPSLATGDNACPFTTFYWDFLERHQERLADNRRMAFQLANLRRKSVTERSEIAAHARYLRRQIRDGSL